MYKKPGLIISLWSKKGNGDFLNYLAILLWSYLKSTKDMA
jgi:hypothetical protein